MCLKILLDTCVKEDIWSCDIYSLGALFYRLITLERPWHFDANIRTLRGIGNNDRRVWELIKQKVSVIGTMHEAGVITTYFMLTKYIALY